MDIDQLVQLISTLGFPIVCCAALFWYMVKQAERHKAEADALRKSIDSNTLVITQLLERMGVETECIE